MTRDRLLMLMQLDLNRQASEQRYAKLIREELLKNGGRSPARRALDDPSGQPNSLEVLTSHP